MHEWIVHVERKNMRDWEINVTLPQQRGRSYIYYNSDTTNVSKEVDWGSPTDAETWYCLDEGSAKALALKMSMDLPGRNVNVYKLAHVARSQASPPVITPLSEKGLIPE